MPKTFVEQFREKEARRIKGKRVGYSRRIQAIYQKRSDGFPTVSDIHVLCDAMNIEWDDDQKFMDWTERLTGKRKLDELDQKGRELVYSALESGQGAVLYSG